MRVCLRLLASRQSVLHRPRQPVILAGFCTQAPPQAQPQTPVAEGKPAPSSAQAPSPGRGRYPRDRSGKSLHDDYIEKSVANLPHNIKHMDFHQICHLIRTCGQARKFQDALSVFTTALQNQKVDSSVVEAMLRAAFACKEYAATTNIIALSTKVDLQPSVFSTLQTGYTEVGELNLAYEVFLAQRERDLPLEAKDSALFAALLSAGMKDHAGTVLKIMYQTRSKYGLPDEPTWAAAAQASTKNPGLLLEVIDANGDEDAKMGKLPASYYLHMISAVSRTKDASWAFYMRARDNDVFTHIQQFQTIMSAFASARLYEYVPQVYQDMTSRGLLPDENTYGIVVDALCRLGLFDQIEETLHDMRQRKLTPSQRLYQRTFDTFLRSGHVLEASKLLDTMQKDGWRPTPEMYSRLIGLVSKATDYSKDERVIEGLQRTATGIDEVSYNKLTRSVIQIRMGEYAYNDIQRLQQSGFNFEQNLKNVLSSLQEDDDGTKLLSVLQQMEASGITPSEYTINILMNQAVQRKDLEQVKMLYAKLTQYGITPNDITKNIFMKGLGVVGLVDEQWRFWNEEYTNKDLIAFNNFMHLLVKGNRIDLMVRVFSEMNAAGVEPNEITANILVRGYAKAQNLPQCIAVFEAFKQKLGSMTAVAYNMMVECCLLCQQPLQALQWMERMSQDGVEPHSKLGWAATTQGIKNLSDLEKTFEEMQKNPKVLDAIRTMVQKCVEFKRPDLLQHSIMLVGASDTLKWTDVEALLPENVVQTIREWDADGQISKAGKPVTSHRSTRTRHDRGFRDMPHDRQRPHNRFIERVDQPVPIAVAAPEALAAAGAAAAAATFASSQSVIPAVASSSSSAASTINTVLAADALADVASTFSSSDASFVVDGGAAAE